jgi:hypothetical protein
MSSEYKNIVIMKFGPYAGYSVEEIINIKKDEEKKTGMFFIGYSGVFCRPNVVNNLVSYSKGEKIYLMFVETKSDFIPTTVDRFNKYSVNKTKRIDLPKDILLVGNKSKDHFAFIGKDLKKADIELDLSQYSTLCGNMFPNLEQPLSEYFNFRVDKACGVFTPNTNNEKIVKVSYISELINPYSVYISA